MASHVVVVDGRVRKARVPTAPSTPMTDVLQQGCQKLGLNSDQFVLKYNNKPVDLSVVFRLSGLPSGAQLELVQTSRSPTVISVALQLPSSQSSPGQRFVQKFSSSTTLWQILRVIETSQNINITERALPSTGVGAGRLFYEMPVLNIMNRDLGSFGDLQKTLAQIGVSSGNVLLKLSFKTSSTPLEEAMQEISRYFKDDSTVVTPSVSEEPKMDIKEASKPAPESEPEPKPKPEQVLEESPPKEQDTKHPETSQAPTSETQTMSPNPPPKSEISTPSFTVYSPPPASSTPVAASIPFHESDYVPTVEHAQAHQSRLQVSSRNTRLASDAELAAQEEARVSSLAAVSLVRVRVRFPDLSVLETEMPKGKTKAAELYSLVRANLRHQTEPFILRYVDGSGKAKDVPDDMSVDVVQKLAWRGGTLVTFLWTDVTSTQAKKEPALKDNVLKIAKRMDIPVVSDSSSQGTLEGGFFGNVLKDFGKTASKITGVEKEAKLKNLLGFGKKK